MKRILHTIARISLLVALGLAGCDSEEAPDEVSGDDLGFSEVPLEAPPGYVSFYTGKTVLAEVAETGTFVPRDDVDYSMIRVPQSTVEAAENSATPVTVSLCLTASDVTLFHQSVGDVYHAEEPGSTNCSPEVTFYDGRMTVEYQSGQEGLFGVVVIGTLENGNLFAGASAAARIPSACPDDPSHSNSGMLIGHWQVAPDPEILESCSPPDDGV